MNNIQPIISKIPKNVVEKGNSEKDLLIDKEPSANTTLTTETINLSPVVKFSCISITEEDKQWLRSNCENNFMLAEKIIDSLKYKSETALQHYLEKLGFEEQSRVQLLSKEVYKLGLNKDLSALEALYSAIQEQIDKFLKKVTSKFFKKKVDEKEFKKIQTVLESNSFHIEIRMHVFFLVGKELKSVLDDLKVAKEAFFEILLCLKFILNKYKDCPGKEFIASIGNNRLASVMLSANLNSQLIMQVENEFDSLGKKKRQYENLLLAIVPTYLNTVYTYFRKLSQKAETTDDYNALVNLLKSASN